MSTGLKWAGRIGLLGIGTGLAYTVVTSVEGTYRVHEMEIATRPIFDPPGLKYAQVTAPERDGVRGWVAGMKPPPRVDGIKRVLAVGDSLTWGLGVQLQEAWPAELEGLIPNAEVFNLGMCGYDAEQGVSLITHHLESWDADLIVWAHYTNDIDPTFLMFGAHDEHPVFVGTNIPKPALMAPESISLWLVRNSAMFRSVQAAKLARVLSSGHTPVAPTGWYERQLERLKRWSTTSQTPVIAVALPDHTQANPDLCSTFIAEKDCNDQAIAYRRITDGLSRSGLQWVDGQRIYQSSGKPHFMGADRDTGHPTPEGHRVLASGLAPLVSAALSSSR